MVTFEKPNTSVTYEQVNAALQVAKRSESAQDWAHHGELALALARQQTYESWNPPRS